jgi:energy-coupling factor transporter ATP-binding protein EcfA2
MIAKFLVESFKSLEKVEVELGNVNVFIGANGSGKSNLLEAIGVLSAAADGKVTDQVLLQRGVRPGVPKLYKTAFAAPSETSGIPPHIHFASWNDHKDKYEVSLHNPLDDPSPAWTFKHELWERGSGTKIVGRSPASRGSLNPKQGLASLKAVEMETGDTALTLLKALQGYVIYSPTTSVLRGTTAEVQPRNPLGLSGGRLPEAINELLHRHKQNDVREVLEDALRLIDWASEFSASPAFSMPLSPSAASSSWVVKFVDRFMKKGRNALSGYDASEGALFVLFLAVLAAHPLSPQFFAVDNADHGLNPKLAKELIRCLCHWVTNSKNPRQLLLTTHNPLVLDGLPLQDERIRLFIVSRSNLGRSLVRRIVLDDVLRGRAEQGWTLSRLWVMGLLGGVMNV